MWRCPRGKILSIVCLLSAAAAWTSPAAAQDALPQFTAKGGTLDLTWRERDSALLRSSLVLRQPRLKVVRGAQPEAVEALEEDTRLPVPGEVVREASPVPVDLESLAIHDATVVFIDPTRSHPQEPALQIYDLQVLVENFTTDRRLSGGLPTMISVRGRIGTEADISLFATVNPWSDTLDFAGRAQITGLRLEQLAGLVEERADIRLTDGTISVFIEFSVREGQITGTIKAFLTGVELEPAGPGLADQLKSWFASSVVQILSRDVGDVERMATEIPLSGRLLDPNVNLKDALIGVVVNAFIEAIAVTYG